jgi:hypothetical protein
MTPDFNQLRREATELCERLAAADLRAAGLCGRVYIVLRSELSTSEDFPADLTTCVGATSVYLADILRPQLSDYRGHGPAMVLNDLLLQRTPDVETIRLAFLGTAVHELAHNFDWRFERPEVPCAAGAIRRHMVAFIDGRKIDQVAETYEGHEARFIRAAMHLHHRAQRIGVRLVQQLVVNPCLYGLSWIGDYHDAIGREPEVWSDVPLLKVLDRPAPRRLQRLWLSDVERIRRDRERRNQSQLNPEG